MMLVMLAGDWLGASITFAVIFLALAVALIYFGRRLKLKGRAALGVLLIVFSLPFLLLGGICGMSAVAEYQASKIRRGF